MKKQSRRFSKLAWLTAMVTAVLAANQTYAHCDGMDGPVVLAAQAALASNDVNKVLIWVRENDEPEIQRVFEQTMNVRTLSPAAQELADLYFFETLVRIHRTAEGAPYTGLKPAGRDLGPAIPAADEALQSADIAPLTNLLVAEMSEGLHDRYDEVMAVKGFNVEDVAAGREYVEAYVDYIHYAEILYEAAASNTPGHYPEEPVDAHEDE